MPEDVAKPLNTLGSSVANHIIQPCKRREFPHEMAKEISCVLNNFTAVHGVPRHSLKHN